MKKHHLSLLLAALVLTLVSCNKDKDDNLSEGQYNPAYKISEISIGTTPCQTWSWGTAKLSTISDFENNATYNFSYTGDKLAQVVIAYSDGTPSESIFYTYQGSLLSRIEIVEGTTTLYSMDVMHDANDQISTMNIDVSDQYLVRLATEMAATGKSSRAISQLLSPSAVQALSAVGDILQHSPSSPSKYSISNKHFAISYSWQGSNLIRENLSGNVTATVTLADAADAFDFGTYSSIITSLLGDDSEWPLSATVNVTTNYTYDDGRNPFRYCWSEGLTARNLSQNNPLSAITAGEAEATITIELPESVPFVGGMEYPYERTVPMDETHNYSYSYGKKKYPKSYTVDGKSYNITYLK